MEEDKIILAHHGFWLGSAYKNGEELLVFMSLRTISFEKFLENVHRIVQADQRIYDYVFHCLVRTEDCGVVKSVIMSERDLQRVGRIFKTPKIFVTLKSKHQGTHAPSFHGGPTFSQPGIRDMRPNGFVHSMAPQGTYGNPFAYGCQTPFGYHFPPGYEMNYMQGPAPYLSAPNVHGAWPNSAPVVDQPRPKPAPDIYKTRPSSAPIVNKPRPSSTPIVSKLRPSKAPIVGQPWPSIAPIVSQSRPNKASIVSQPRPNKAPIVNKSCIPNKALEVDQEDDDNDDDDEDEDEDSEEELARKIIYKNDKEDVPPTGNDSDKPKEFGVGDIQGRVLRSKSIPTQRINLVEVTDKRDSSDKSRHETLKRHRQDSIIPGASFHSTDLVPTAPKSVEVGRELHVGKTYDFKEQSVTSASSNNEVAKLVRKIRSGSRRCGNCREAGHTRKFCPTLNIDSSEEEG